MEKYFNILERRYAKYKELCKEYSICILFNMFAVMIFGLSIIITFTNGKIPLEFMNIWVFCFVVVGPVIFFVASFINYCRVHYLKKVISSDSGGEKAFISNGFNSTNRNEEQDNIDEEELKKCLDISEKRVSMYEIIYERREFFINVTALSCMGLWTLGLFICNEILLDDFVTIVIGHAVIVVSSFLLCMCVEQYSDAYSILQEISEESNLKKIYISRKWEE